MTWTELVAKLPYMTEAEIVAKIAKEAQRDNLRASHLTRMHMRLCKLRAARERRELLGKRNLD